MPEYIDLLAEIDALPEAERREIQQRAEAMLQEQRAARAAEKDYGY